jgi:serine/threonine-protein kinase
MLDPVPPGSTIDGKYRVERVLGRGGMGVVVSAKHIELGQKVAIKVLREGVLESDEALQRFMQEARALARLESEHVVRVFDVGTLESGAPYMVMEHLNGSDLSALLKKRKAPLPVDETVGYVLEACTGLAEAHAVGIVHRDLKPGNLFRVQKADGTTQIKVLDFGIAKTAEGPRLTSDRMVLGSPRYMSPEQLQTPRDVDQRTDIWALGAISYRLLADRPPFDGPDLDSTLDAILKGEFTPLPELVPGVPMALSEAIERCLTQDKHKRFFSVADLSRALAEFGPPGSKERVARIARLSGAPRPEDLGPKTTVPMKGIPEPTEKLGPSLPRAEVSLTVDEAPTPASSVAPPPQKATSAWKIAGVTLAVAFVAGVVLVASGALGALTGLSARAEYADAPLPPLDPKSVDTSDVIQAAHDTAKKLDPSAELTAIDVDDPIRGGSIDLTKGDSLVLQFDYADKRGSEKGGISVEVTQKGLLGARVPLLQLGKSVPAPKCSLKDAWKAATNAGVHPQSSATFHYADTVGVPTWVIQVPDRPELKREIDGQTCRVVPANP